MIPTPQLVRARPRMIIASLIGLVTAVLLHGAMLPGTRVLLGWDITVWTYLLLIWVKMARDAAPQVAALALQEDESAPIILALVSAAAVASIAAIVFDLAAAKHVNTRAGALHLAFAVITVLGGWFLVPTIFTLHYARLYYRDNDGEKPLAFPDAVLAPNYWDFMYFSFTIAVASQTSDIALRSTQIRRVALAQSVLAFFFNASILALSINIAAGLV